MRVILPPASAKTPEAVISWLSAKLLSMKHGTRNCYTNQNCRCEQCRRAALDYSVDRAQALGGWRSSGKLGIPILESLDD